MSRRSSLHVKPAQVEIGTPRTEVGYLVPSLLLFAGSGCAALIYEIVWFQLLQLVIGSSAISLGLLLAAYLGGLCLGSAALPRLISARLHPMRVYALLELGIGAFGIVALFGVPLIGRIYLASAASGLAGVVLRGAIATLCLLPPTLLMGGSLPAMARSVETTPRGVSWLGLLYAANIAGAVVGCLAAGFYLLRVYDIAVATYIAAAINLVVGLIALALATGNRNPSPVLLTPEIAKPESRRIGVYVVIALSGLSALGAEVVWTRLLSLILGATVYTFSIVLAVFLLGLWAGSSAGSFLARRLGEPRLALAVCQLLLAATIAWTAFTLAYSLPFWPVDPWLSTNPWLTFDLDVTRCVRAIFPATLLWGASFPLALAGAAIGGEDAGRLAGEIYAANSAGSIVGALMFSLVLIPALGTQGSQRLLIWIAAAGAATALLSAGLGAGKRIALAVATVVVAWGLSATVAPVPWQVIAYGRRAAPVLRGLDDRLGVAEPLFVGEGVNSSVAIIQRGDQRSFFVSGKSEASTAILDMRLQRMMGHLPALIHSSPRSVLVVGFGAGVTGGSFVPYPEVQQIVVCELEPLIPPASGEYFAKQNDNLVHDGRTRIVSDDARHYVFTTREKFDVITTDPIHPWVKGTSALYSEEFYELEKSRLNPGGVVAQWLPLYESDEETVKTELATFFSVFPNATIWSNFLNGDGYDLVLLGRADDAPIDIDALARRLGQPSYARVSKSLAEAEFHSVVDLLATYAGRAQDLGPMLAGAQINDDLNMRLQYLAGMGLNSVSAPQIYRDILAYRKFPENLLTGSSEQVNSLRELLGRPVRTF
jgi:spermidine synthase